MTMLIGIAMLFAAVLFLAVAVGHDTRSRDEPTNTGSTLTTLATAVAVVLLFTNGVALIAITWVLSVTSSI